MFYINKIINRLNKEGLRFAAFLLENLKYKYMHDDVPMSENISHSNWKQYLINLANENNLSVLEIGSREVTGKSDFRKLLTNAKYTGFDYYNGDNVDVVGDIHKLSQYFPNEKFDLIFSSAVLEHIAMPWIAAQEMAKLLNVNGYIFAETHYSYSSHERPWHFFQFSENALEILFNSQLGFECIEKGCSNPLIGIFSKQSAPYLRGLFVSGLYCHSEILVKKVADVPDFSWYNVDLDKLYNGTKYCKPGTVK